MELSQEAPTPAQDVSQPAAPMDALRDEIASMIDLPEDRAQAQAKDILDLLIEQGHVIPGAPPAAQILADARSFAERLTLSNLAARILNMLSWSGLVTPETDAARRWIEDYLEGKNHGPIGKAMLWPGRLPGLASQLRDWGFVPTIATPGQPSYVARAVQAPSVQ